MLDSAEKDKDECGADAGMNPDIVDKLILCFERRKDRKLAGCDRDEGKM